MTKEELQKLLRYLKSKGIRKGEVALKLVVTAGYLSKLGSPEKPITPAMEKNIKSLFGVELKEMNAKVQKGQKVPRETGGTENDLIIVRGVDYHDKYIKSLEADKERLLKLLESNLTELNDGQRLLHAQVMAVQQWDVQQVSKGDKKKEDELKHQINTRVASNYRAYQKKDILAGNGM